MILGPTTSDMHFRFANHIEREKIDCGDTLHHFLMVDKKSLRFYGQSPAMSAHVYFSVVTSVVFLYSHMQFLGDVFSI